jgi:hypothetical protein
VLQGARRIRVAQHHSQSPIHRLQHEPCGNERAQAEHRENEWRRPMACATDPQPTRSSPHSSKVPEGPDGIKWGIHVQVAGDRRCGRMARCRIPATCIVQIRLAIHPSLDEGGAALSRRAGLIRFFLNQQVTYFYACHFGVGRRLIGSNSPSIPHLPSPAA